MTDMFLWATGGEFRGVKEGPGRLEIVMRDSLGGWAVVLKSCKGIGCGADVGET